MESFIEGLRSLGVVGQSIMIVLYTVVLLALNAIYTDKARDIKLKYKAQLFDFIDNILYNIYITSTGRLEKYLRNSVDKNTICSLVGENSCKTVEDVISLHIDVSKRTLYEVIITRTRKRLETIIYRNGFHSMDKEQLFDYISNLAQLLYDSNKEDLDILGFYNYELFRDTDDIRYSIEESVVKTRKIIEEAIQMKKLETDDILDMVFKIPKFIKNIINK